MPTNHYSANHIIDFTNTKIEYSINQSAKILLKKVKIIEEDDLLFILFILPYSKGIFVDLLIMYNILLIFHSYFLLLLHRVTEPCLRNINWFLQSRIALISVQDFLFALNLHVFLHFLSTTSLHFAFFKLPSKQWRIFIL